MGSDDKADLAEWIGRVRAHLASHLNPITGDPGEFPLRGHYERVAQRLLALTDDLEAARLGYLHGLEQATLTELPAELVSHAVHESLAAYDRLMAYEGVSHSDAFRLPAGLPATEATLRAAVLIVVEQLDHWDQTLEGLSWTRSFRREPSPVPWSADLKPRGMDREEAVRRLEHVVAPLARLVGLWDHRNLAMNLVAHALEPERLRDSVRRACEPALRQLVEDYRRQIGMHVDGPTEWNFRHPGSMYRRIDSKNPQDEPLRFGFVTIPIDADDLAGVRDKAWLTIARLHSAFPYKDSALRDFFSRAKAGYAALHTELVVGAEERIVPVRAGARRVLRSGADLKQRMLSALEHAAPPQVHVYTPQSERVVLPWGATVLNLAAEIHSSFPARCLGAWDGDTRLGPLDRLTSGRTIEVILADEHDRILPPSGWEKLVPPQTVRVLRRLLRGSKIEAEQRAGREVVRDFALQTFSMEVVEDDDIDHAVAQVLGDPADGTPEEWLRRLGRREALDRKQRRTYLERICRRLLRESIAFPSLELEPDMQGLPVKYCGICNPNPDGYLVGERVDNRRALLLHRDAEARCCGPDWFVVRRRFHHRFRQWFEVETESRTGVTADLTQVFRDHKVDFSEIVARNTARQRGVFRFETRRLRLDVERALLSGLRQVAGTAYARRVVEDERATLSPELPPPRLGAERRIRSAYTVGAPVFTDEAFYGRDASVEKIHDLLRVEEQPEVADVYLTGAYRVGKTSVLHRIRHRLLADPLAVTVYLQAHQSHRPKSGEVWDAFAGRLADKLRVTARQWSQRRGSDLLLTGDAADIVRSIRAGGDRVRVPRVVLLIDEAVGLLTATQRHDPDGWQRLRSDVDRLREAGARIVWAGPPTPSSLDPNDSIVDADDFLRRCEVVALRPFERWELAQSLLTMDRGAPTPARVLSPRNARYVLQLTGGEPSWLQAIGQALEAITAGPELIFDRPAIDKAAVKVLRQRTLFRPRTADDGARLSWGGLKGSDVWQTQLILAELLGRGEQATTERLARGLEVGVEFMDHLLEGMQRMGAVRPEEGDPWTWRFSAPLLERYVRRFASAGRSS